MTIATASDLEYRDRFKRGWTSALLFGSVITTAVIGILIVMLLLENRGTVAMENQGKKIRGDQEVLLDELRALAEAQHFDTRKLIKEHHAAADTQHKKTREIMWSAHKKQEQSIVELRNEIKAIRNDLKSLKDKQGYLYRDGTIQWLLYPTGTFQ